MQKNNVIQKCFNSCAALLTQVRELKARTKAAFAAPTAGYESMVDLAINEAEAIAWQTAYPHLVFPTLAEEKVSAVARWAVRQRAINGRYALAA
jgi:hypothetical protein